MRILALTLVHHSAFHTEGARSEQGAEQREHLITEFLKHHWTLIRHVSFRENPLAVRALLKHRGGTPFCQNVFQVWLPVCCCRCNWKQKRIFCCWEMYFCLTECHQFFSSQASLNPFHSTHQWQCSSWTLWSPPVWNSSLSLLQDPSICPGGSGSPPVCPPVVVLLQIMLRHTVYQTKDDTGLILKQTSSSVSVVSALSSPLWQRCTLKRLPFSPLARTYVLRRQCSKM